MHGSSQLLEAEGPARDSKHIANGPRLKHTGSAFKSCNAEATLPYFVIASLRYLLLVISKRELFNLVQYPLSPLWCRQRPSPSSGQTPNEVPSTLLTGQFQLTAVLGVRPVTVLFG